MDDVLAEAQRRVAAREPLDQEHHIALDNDLTRRLLEAEKAEKAAGADQPV